MAPLILDFGRAYLAAGVLVAAVFLTWGVGRVDANARGAYAFRPLVAPGIVLLWPLVLWRWRAIGRDADPGRRHRPPLRAQDAAALGMALALPAIIAIGLLARQNGPLEREAVLLAPPEAAP